MMTSRHGKIAVMVLSICFVFCLWDFSNISLVRRLTPLLWQTCFLIVAAISLNLVVGTMGQLSLGHCGFMAIGAYASALFSLWCQRKDLFVCKEGVWYLTIVLASLFVALMLTWIVGYLVAIPALRLKGDYLAIITLGFGLIIVNVINNLPFAGMEGLSLGSSSSVLYKNGLGFSNYLLCKWIFIPVISTGVVLYLINCLVDSPMGKNVKAICQDPIGAGACGIDVPKCKIEIFAMSAALTSVAGWLYACSMTTLTTSTFSFSNNGILSSSFLVAICVMGGLGSTKGVCISATAVSITNYILGQMGLNQLPGALGVIFSYPMLVYGILLMVFTLWNPKWRDREK